MINTVPNYWLFGLITTAANYGVTAAQLFHTAGLGNFDTYHCKDRILVSDLDKLLRVLSRLCNNPCVFFERAENDVLDKIELLIATAQSIKDALRLFNSYRQLVHPFAVFTALEDERKVTIRYTPPVQMAEGYYYAECFLATAVTYARRISTNQLNLYKAAFKHPEPRHSDCYREFFKAPVEFGCHDNYFQIARKDFNQKLSGSNELMNRWVLTRTQSLCNEMPDVPLVEQIRTFLMSNKKTQKVTLDTIAKYFKTTPRSLQRQFSNVDITFSKLKENVLLWKAMNLLENRSLTTQDIADQLGFTELGSFYKAFKRWSGKTAGEYRKECGSKR